MKNLRKVLSVVLAVAMLACSMAIAATTASADDNYTTIQSWGINDFNNFESSGLTSDAAHEVLARDKSVGMAGYGIWGYVSTGTNETVSGGTNYNYHILMDWDGVVHNNTTEIGVDCWVSDYNDGPTFSSGISTETIQNAYNEALEKGFHYTADGNRYFEVDAYLTIPAECDGYTGEFRIYTRGFINYRIYTVELYGEDLFNPVAVIDSGEANPHNDDTGIRTGEAPYIENHNYTLPRGFRVMRGDFAEPKLALGGTSKELAAGKYAGQYDLYFDGVYCGDDDVLATANVKNAEGAVIATKDIKRGDITCTIKDSQNGNTTGNFLDGTASVVVPFTADANGVYSIELLTTGKANVTVTTASFAAVIPAERIDEVKEAIDAIGEVKYDPDIPEDSGDAITNARTKYDALEADYGDISNIIDNAPKLTAAESTYQGKISDYNDMVTAAKAVKEAIHAIPLPVTEESVDFIVVAREGFDAFVASYGKEKARIHIGEEDKKTLEDAEAAIPDSDVMYGDVDGDKAVTATDALWALQAYVGSRALDEAQTKAADVNIDKTIDTSDALAILQFAVKLRDKLPTVEVK